MESKQVRGTRVLLPSDDNAAVTIWPYPSTIEEEKVTNAEFRNVDLSSHRWNGVTVSRARFVDCRMMGIRISDVSFSDVLFEGCQLDYADFSRVRAKGSVTFVNCKLKESAFEDSDLSGIVFADCLLQDAEFSSAKMAGTDLRGSDLSGVKGLLSLKGVEVTSEQLTTLFESLTRELDLKVSEL